MRKACASTATDPANWEQEARTAVRLVVEGEPFLVDFRRTLETVLDLAYGNTRLGVTRERIRQLQEFALCKLREMLEQPAVGAPTA